MDISQRYVEQAKSKNRTALIKIADIEKKFPFPDRFFDIVYCTEVLEHVNKPADVLGEIFRVTSTNGIVILSTYNHFCFPNLITFNAFKDKYISSDHLREYSYFSFKNEFENYFEIMNFQSTGCEWKRLKKFFSTHKRIYRFFARFPIFNFLIFKLRKNEV
jgi:2-polyprenyl-3-methyl-5-hydroxy-6-metoxy-1,4-benzoquinol methylase